MIKLNQPQKIWIVACSTATIAFFGYELYKEWKFQKDVLAESAELDKILEAHAAVRNSERETKSDGGFINPIEAGEVFLVDRASMHPEIPGAPMYHNQPEYKAPVEEWEEDEEEPYYDPQDVEEGVSELRFPPSSEDALHQYKEMKLAEFDPNANAKKVLYKMFRIPFVPSNNADAVIMSNMIHDRQQFFGPESIWNGEVTIADLILYFGTMLDFDLDSGVEHWVHYLLYMLDINARTPVPVIEATMKRVVNHAFVTHRGFGIFGLDDAQMNYLIRHRLNVGVYADNNMSFLAQYHQFLEDRMEDQDSGHEIDED